MKEHIDAVLPVRHRHFLYALSCIPERECVILSNGKNGKESLLWISRQRKKLPGG